jgi:hypothetical protein
MTREQRAKIDSMLRSQPAAPPRTIEEQRAWYAMRSCIWPDRTPPAVAEPSGRGGPDQALDRAALFLRQHIS